MIPEFGESENSLWKIRGYLKSEAAACVVIVGLPNFALRTQIRIFTDGFESLSFCLSDCLKLLGCDWKPTIGFSLADFHSCGLTCSGGEFHYGDFKIVNS